MTATSPHEGFTDEFVKTLAKQLDAEARELQRLAARKQAAADACRKELRRRARERKAAAAK